MNSSSKAVRRRLLSAGVAAAVASFLGVSGRSLASMEAVEKAIADLGRGETPEDGGITLTIPAIAENGNSVAVSFSVDSPMTKDDYVDAVMILAPQNPTTKVALFHFTPMSGSASATSRMRLAQTQEVIAVARFNDGHLQMVTTQVKVTIGGCGAQL